MLSYCIFYVFFIVGVQVELLLRVHHTNLVSLVGYCDERGHLALIYEYMSNVDLKHHLSGERFIYVDITLLFHRYYKSHMISYFDDLMQGNMMSLF